MEQLSTLLQKHNLEAARGISEIITPEELKEAMEILTKEEIETAFAIAIREARVTKRAQIRTEEYRKKIFEDKKKPSVTADQLYSWILDRAEKEVKGFSLTDREKDLYKTLCWYFTGDSLFEKSGFNLNKGLWLYGGVGCGKTNLMKLFRENPLENYGVIESIKIADLYKDKEIGIEVIDKYAKTTSICFDDFGTEIESGESSHFGNRKNVLGEIVLRHYTLNEDKVFRFHFTTNLTTDQVGQLYGQRVRSRLREMCNIISLEGIEDKRK